MVKSASKKTIALSLSLIFILCFCSSCFGIHNSDQTIFSDTYLDTFWDHFYVADYNLFYTSCGEWVEDVTGTPGYMYITPIPDTDVEEYVIGGHCEYTLIGGVPTIIPFIFQRKTAPIPRKDWTISDISILKGHLLPPYLDNSNYGHGSYLKLFESVVEIESAAYYSWRDMGQDPVLLQELKSAWDAQPVMLGDAEFPFSEMVDVPGQTYHNFYYCVFCVRFEENPNLIWMASIAFDESEEETRYYLWRLDIYEETVEYLPSQHSYYYPLGERWNSIIDSIVNG